MLAERVCGGMIKRDHCYLPFAKQLRGCLRQALLQGSLTNQQQGPGVEPIASTSSALALNTVRISMDPPNAAVSLGSSKYMSLTTRR